MKSTSFLTATAVIQDLAMLVCLVIFVITPKAGRKQFLLLWLSLLIGFINDISGFIGFFVFRTVMNFSYNIGALLIYPLYIQFYKTLVTAKNIRLILNLLLISFTAFALINMFFIQGINNVNSYTFTLSTIVLTITSVLFFYVLIKELPTESITRLPMFWINTGVLIYFSGTFFQYLLADYIVNVLKGDIINTWTIKNFLGIVYYGIISVGLWLNRNLYLPSSSARNQRQS